MTPMMRLNDQRVTADGINDAIGSMATISSSNSQESWHIQAVCLAGQVVR
jgi:hypothetical protein